MMVPTMIFGHLLTSSNFNDDDKKVTGGRNGYGAKLCNVFSTKFVVETCTSEYKRAFKQVWENNMAKTTAPKVKEFCGKDYTKITFVPDLTKFKMENLDNDIVALFHRRAYDIAASARGVRVFLNGTKLPVKGFRDYVDLFLKDKEDETGNKVKFNYEVVNDRWELAVAPSENGFQQISFVNSIATTKGGRHVDYVADMVVKNMVDTIKKKNKNGIDIKPFQIRNHMWIFINCLVENPTFDSQTKEHMTLQAKSFGSRCAPSEKFYLGVIKSGIVEAVLQWAKFKAENLLAKTGAGRKQNKIKGIPKLEDANDAGTKNSVECTLILTEGDSAKTLAVAGLGVVGRDRYGVFPLRGKLLNVREASHKQIMDNAEISALVKILGIQYKKKYQSIEDLRTLRYGKLMIMTDQDHDGSHIKGLIINFVHHNWPSLLQMNFIEEFITPIVKAIKGNNSVSFYSMPELEEWKKRTLNWKTYKLKYYKGLGTSTSKEAKEYFTDMQRHRILFRYQGQLDDDQITMAFSKKCIEQRKDWLTTWMENTKRRKEMGMGEDIIYDKDVRAITYSDFINKELVLFSNLDNERSIPSLVDGLKPGQRKVLFTCFKRNDKREIKVAQLAGSVAEHSAYHHGEQSLMSTIINLAQNYVGSNNINILQPIGQFGTRLQGGKDSASPRYIFTQLSPLAKLMFDSRDEPLLKNLFDDNQRIEPEWYCPILPVVLVNGADGIGTGWMTKVPNFNPREIVNNLKKMIRGDEPSLMRPWYKNFKGDIIEISPQKYAVNGVVSILSDTKIEITELPVATWTQAYKEGVVEPMSTGTDKIQAVLTDYKEYHTDTTVKFVISMKPDTLDKFQDEGLHKVFKLQSVLNLTSMVLFDKNGCLRKYSNVADILREFFELRIEMYTKRRDYLLGILSAEASKLSNQARFILEKCDGKITVENKKKKLMIDELVQRKYDSDPVKAWKSRQATLQSQQVEDTGDATDEEPEEGRDFDYILGMSIMSLTLERKEALLKNRDEKQRELDALKRKTPNDLYNDDLDAFLIELDRVEKEELEDSPETKKKAVAKSKGMSKKALLDTCPSPMGRKVAPTIDDLVKKVEAANKVKEKKGKAKAQKKKDGEENGDIELEKDEFDLMLEDNDSLVNKLNSSSEGADLAANGKVAAKKPREKKPPGEKKPRAKPAKDGLKQTKLNFKAKPKSPAKNKKKGSDWDSDDASDSSFSFSTKVAKKKPAAKKNSFSDSDSDVPARPRKKAIQKKLPFSGGDSGSEIEEIPAPKKPTKVVAVESGSESDEPVVTKKNANKKKPAANSNKRAKAVVLSSDSESDELVVVKSKDAKKAKKGSGSDDDFDFEEESPQKSYGDMAAADRERRNRKQAKYVFDDEESDFSD
ncbi:unnamed protein product [Allacma fusca]|uniref:DNA topoisomerase 2 n=1 Tax=Allacma fusca TaxID=39272 RepID=A0A8J2J0V1_9HEXA|nr:unnamed protein product [Allacma fusca]